MFFLFCYQAVYWGKGFSCLAIKRFIGAKVFHVLLTGGLSRQRFFLSCYQEVYWGKGFSCPVVKRFIGAKVFSVLTHCPVFKRFIGVNVFPVLLSRGLLGQRFFLS